MASVPTVIACTMRGMRWARSAWRRPGWAGRRACSMNPARMSWRWLLGTSQAHDAEPEEPDMLIACMPAPPTGPLPGLPEAVLQAFASLSWQGTPNHLSPAHVDWGIEAFAAEVRKPHGAYAYEPFADAAAVVVAAAACGGTASHDPPAAQCRGHGRADAPVARGLLPPARQDPGRSRCRAIQHTALEVAPAPGAAGAPGGRSRPGAVPAGARPGADGGAAAGAHPGGPVVQAAGLPGISCRCIA